MRGIYGMRKVLIIGAGPAGLTAAYELLTDRQPGNPEMDNYFIVIVHFRIDGQAARQSGNGQ